MAALRPKGAGEPQRPDGDADAEHHGDANRHAHGDLNPDKDGYADADGDCYANRHAIARRLPAPARVRYTHA